MQGYDRKDAERRFHDDRYTEETRAGLAKYYTVLRASLGEFRDAARAAAAGADVLEYGCGAEPHALDVARDARSVVGIDLSPVAVEQATAAAAEAGLDHARFRVMDAEALEFADDSFDLVYGSAVIHHLDVARSLSEIARVLRPSGRALFIEPMGHNPAINLYRRLTPTLRTPDEHPLRMSDLRLASSFFRTVDYRFYHLFSLAAVPFRATRAFGRLLAGLDAFDRMLFAAVPPARRMAWYVVMTLDEPG
jgi:SAM-dependent methyltransferase